MLANGKTGDVAVDELNGKTGVYRRISWRHRWDEDSGVVSSRTGVGRRRACVGGGARGLDAEEGLLALRDVPSNRKSVENERKEDKDTSLPPGCHGGRGYTVLEGEKRVSSCSA